MLFLNIVFVLAALILLLYAQVAPKDCTRLIADKTMTTCCRKPLSNKTIFDEPCNKIPKMIKGLPNPCAYECAFNAWQVMDGNRLDMHNLFDMLMRVYANNYDYVNVQRMAYYKCQAVAEQYYSVIQAANAELNTKCSGLPMFYVKCAEMQVFLDCPVQYLNPELKCLNAHDKLSQCLSELHKFKSNAKTRSGTQSVHTSAEDQRRSLAKITSKLYLYFLFFLFSLLSWLWF